jgi:hypothetical protein
MNRITMMGISALTVVATTAGALSLVAPANAATTSTAARSATVTAASCAVSRHKYPYPKGRETFQARTAGSVTIAPARHHTVKVVGVKPAKGWHAFIDSRRGSSVDVYFRSGKHRVKFEAEVNDGGGLTVTISKCAS